MQCDLAQTHLWRPGLPLEARAMAAGYAPCSQAGGLTQNADALKEASHQAEMMPAPTGGGQKGSPEHSVPV